MSMEPAHLAAATGRGGPWDAVVVGGGHNGLVCAAYLARAGLRTLVLERRPEVGGCLVTAEVAPGARLPAVAHTVGRLAGTIARELDLAGHGLRLVQPAVRVTSVRPDGPPITLWGDAARTARDLREHSPRDAAAWEGFDREVRELSSALWRLMLMTPPDPAGPRLEDALGAARVGWRYRRLGPRHAQAFLRVLPQPVADWLEDRFESDALRALLATRGMRWSSLAAGASGSSAALLTDSAGNDGGAAGESVMARGGPGALAAAMRAAAERAGAEVLTGAEVVAVLGDEDGVRGVALADGTEVRAQRVVSGLDPRRTLLGLLDPAVLGPRLGWQAGNLRARGVSAKLNLALARLPAFAGLDGDDGARRLRGRIVVAPSLRALDEAADPAKYGQPAAEPWLEATIPSLVDPELVSGTGAGGARHVMSVLVQSMPYDLREGDWDARRDEVADAAMRVLETVAPGIGGLVVERQVLTPLDLERDIGLTGGHPMHLEGALDQWFAWRPMLGLARYRLPLPGLYLCGSGAHPGGGVTGVPGRNAAGAVLADARSAQRPS
jgi:phytoene dehydrogenase-like protein